MLIELEEFKRSQKRSFIFEQKKRIGFYHKSKHSVGPQDSWEDGEEIVTLKRDLNKVV